MENALVADPPDGEVYFFGETTFYMAGPTSQGKTDIMNESHRARFSISNFHLNV